MKNLIIIFALIFSTFAFSQTTQERLTQINKEQTGLALKYLTCSDDEQKIIAKAYNLLEIERMQIEVFESIISHRKKRKNKNLENNSENSNEPAHQICGVPNLGNQIEIIPTYSSVGWPQPKDNGNHVPQK